VASKLALIMSKRGLIVAVAIAASAAFGAVGYFHPVGLWDGPG
jgi:hypothetical protein